MPILDKIENQAEFKTAVFDALSSKAVTAINASKTDYAAELFGDDQVEEETEGNIE